MAYDKYQSQRGNNAGEGKKNPFVDELGTQKESDSDSVQDSFTDTGSGWIPMMASNKTRMKFSLWDNMEVPGYSDRQQGFGAPWNGMGESPLRSDETKTYERLVSYPSREIKKIERSNPGFDGLEEDDLDFITDASVRVKRIQKISAIDDSWMQECANQIANVAGDFSQALVNKFKARWAFMTGLKDGNTLRLDWMSNGSRKFLLYVRYDMGSDTYSASSSIYDSKTGVETTLHPWIDDVYVDTLLDPNIWINTGA